MAFSVHNYNGDGSTTQFPVNFTLDYLDRSHVLCYVEGEVDGGGDPIYRTLTWITDSLVDIGTAPALDLEIIIRRDTPKTALYHDYQDGAGIIELNLDESNLQNIMIAHEILDGYSTTRNFNLDMNGFKIVDMAVGENDDDAATVGQMNTLFAQDQVDQAQEWANKAEDSLVSAAAGGDEVDDYSALHHSAKSSAQRVLAETARTGAETAESDASTHEAKAQDWAEEVEDTEVETGKYSALHWAAKAEEHKVPSGGIIMWSGAISAIPLGWLICDGTSSTPNLTDRFVIHADADAAGTNNVGDTGGAHEHTLSIAEMPAHTHPEAKVGVLGAQGGATEYANEQAGVTGSTGGGGAHNNMPAYYALAYIMKS